MEHWQFLIQKQGDRSWHALESPNTEICEGRYRVLARSHLRNTDVEVRVTYFSTQEVPPKRRVQKRVRRTNAEGLMAVIPFTHLRPGMWELRCSGDLISDMLGKSWHYGVKLQVNSILAHAVNVRSNTENNLESNLIEQPDSIADDGAEAVNSNLSNIVSTSFFLSQEDEAIDAPISPVWIKGETADQILQNLIDLALPTSDTLLEQEKVTESLTQEISLPLQLTLDRETYITRWGHLLTIHGSVDLQKDVDPAIENLYAVELRIELRSPLSPGILTQIRQSLADKSLPFTIRSAIDVPADCESKLILADIKLYGATTHGAEVSLLASHSFTITADVADLLAVTNAATANHKDEEQENTPPTSTAEAVNSIDLELFNIAKTTSSGQSQLTHISPNTPIPEQIDPQSLKKTADFRLPQLPVLPENSTEAAVTSDLVLEPSSEVPLLEQGDINVPTPPAPINLNQLVIKQRPRLGGTLPYLKPLQTPSNSDVETPTSQFAEESPQIDAAIDQELNLESVSDDTQLQDESVAEVENQPTTENIDDSLAIEAINDASETPSPAEPPAESGKNEVTQISISPQPSYSSPLIRKWMERQGYSLPEFFTQNNDVPQTQLPTEEPPRISQNAKTPDWEINLPSQPEPETQSVDTDLVTLEEIEDQVCVDTDNLSGESSALEMELPAAEPVQTTVNWLAQEIVVDDGENEPESDAINNNLLQAQQEAIPAVSSANANKTDSSPKMLEPLPVPQLYLPDGELVAGKLVRVRVELPKVSPQVVVKLWMEDCQTRWLLDGPHLLTELLPNSSDNLEVMTQLNIPFGCLEIRIEAIALNTVTQQESHKVTSIKTVIPPDLPDVTLHDLLGM